MVNGLHFYHTLQRLNSTQKYFTLAFHSAIHTYSHTAGWLLLGKTLHILMRSNRWLSPKKSVDWPDQEEVFLGCCCRFMCKLEKGRQQQLNIFFCLYRDKALILPQVRDEKAVHSSLCTASLGLPAHQSAEWGGYGFVLLQREPPNLCVVKRKILLLGLSIIFHWLFFTCSWFLVDF